MLNFIRRYLKYFIFLFIIILLSFSFLLYSSRKISTKKNNKLSSSVIKEEKTSNIIKQNNKEKKIESYFVDIKGAVKNAGVYQMDINSRIIDVINMAGGLLENASVENINLSKKIKDEMYVIIYTKEELQKYYKDQNNKNKEVECVKLECVCPNDKNDACISNKNNNSIDNTVNKISINTASKDELMKLSGIGEAKANSIISYRSEHGDFKNIEDIKNVSGISENIFEKIKDNITL